jgi:hypothetical protein
MQEEKAKTTKDKGQQERLKRGMFSRAKSITDGGFAI